MSSQQTLFAKRFLSRLTLPRRLVFIFIIFLLFSSFTIIYTTMENMKAVQNLATESLESVALALSLSAAHALRSGDPSSLEDVRTIFSDRVVAYAFVVDSFGRVIFHTNRRMTGSLLPVEDRKKFFGYTESTGQKVTLQTGIPAYQYTYPVQGADGREARLRIVLNSLPADRLVARAHQMWWVVGGGLVAFWAVGIFFGWLLIRYMRLQEALAERKHMALIGQMTAVLSHEIRNALGSIKGYTQWVDRKMEPDDVLRQPVGMALGGIERVELLVNELLLYSKDEQHRPERVNLTHLIGESLSLFHEWPGEILGPMENEVWVYVDREKLHRVFINVVQNAIQAMGESGTVSASVEPKGRWVRIRIIDTGPGIRPEEAELVFTPFHTSKVTGTGIGLAYSRKIIEAMGGKIELANRTDRVGAALTIYLPAHKERGVTENG